jgi:hypothetical protein
MSTASGGLDKLLAMEFTGGGAVARAAALLAVRLSVLATSHAVLETLLVCDGICDGSW